MGAQPFWVDEGGDEQAWDFCWLGEDLLPGLVEVEAGKSRDVDVQKNKGTDGAALSDDGYVPAAVTITLRMWTREQWAAWQDVYPKIDPQRPGGLRQPLSIVHPEPNHRGIDTIYVTSISGSSPRRGGVKTETIECLQWFPAPKPVKKSTKPKPPPNAGGTETPDDDTPPPAVDLF